MMPSYDEEQDGGETRKLIAEDDSKQLKQDSVSDDANLENTGLGSTKWREFGIIVLVAVVYFLGLSVDTLLLPFFTHEALSRGLTEVHGGLIFATYDLARFVVTPFCPSMEHRISSPKLIVIGGLMCGLACIAFGLASFFNNTVMFILCLILRLVSGTGAAIISVIITGVSMKSKFFTNNQVYGWLEMAMGLGYMVGPAAGGGLYDLVGYTWTFVIFGFLLIVALVPIYIVLPDVREGEPQPKAESQQGFFDMIRIPEVAILFAMNLALEFIWMGSFTMLSEWLIETFSLEVWEIALMFALYSLMYLLGNPVAAWTTDKGFVHSALISVWAYTAVAFLFVGPSPLLKFLQDRHLLWMLIVIFCIFSFAIPWIFIPTYQLILDYAEHQGYERTSITTYNIAAGVQLSASSLGAMLGPPTSGFITRKLGYPWNQTILAFLALTMILLSVLLLVRSRKVKIDTDQNENSAID